MSVMALTDTCVARFDLLHEVNMQGSYHMVGTVLLHFIQQKSGHFLLISPPLVIT
jgi:NADP-dependent 3-hydroxy acid dehydrogenase YdfG